MKRAIVILLFSLMLAGITSYAADAADSLVGVYDGAYVAGRGLRSNLRIEITEDGTSSVRGKASFYQPYCGGTFPFEGERVGDTLKLAVSGSNTRDPRAYELQVRGKKLIGTLRRRSEVWNIELQ